MGLLDKVKAQATQVAGKAQEAGRAGQAKLEEVQARRRVDTLLRDLGEAVYAERTGSGTAGPDAVARLVEEIRAAEADLAAAHVHAGDDGEAPGTGGDGHGESGSGTGGTGTD
ncbi:MAG: hypothetical protein M0029_12660 [Actinomycetota bacterium]|jgi:hypothetical protein|nr:hypothetical protein [Actinomycetota bacterium]